MPAADTTAIDRAKYVLLTTFRRDGRAVAAPVWVVRHDDGWACTTGADSGKVKRLRHTPTIEVVPCDVRGRVADGAPTFRGTAPGHRRRGVSQGPLVGDPQYRILGPALIGWAKVTSLFGKSAAEVAVVWTIDETD